jgi:thiamine biosynthesis lipoprotein
VTVDLRFPAMGTKAHVLVRDGEPEHAAYALARTRELEQRWSRFIPESELSRVNRAAPEPVAVSDDTLLLAERALHGKRMTGGRFDATLLEPLVAAGYDRDFALLSSAPEENDLAPRVRPSGGHGEVVVDREAGTVCVRGGARLDSGGLGKGLAADLVAEELVAHGASGALVNLGGDLRAAGDPPRADGWSVDLDNPVDRDGPPLARLALAEGGLATSSPYARRWFQGRTQRHHLIDPATGRPAVSDVVSVTVLAAEGWTAEVLAKAAFLAGAAGALALLEGKGLRGVVLGRDGRVLRTA